MVVYTRVCREGGYPGVYTTLCTRYIPTLYIPPYTLLGTPTTLRHAGVLRCTVRRQGEEALGSEGRISLGGSLSGP